MASKDDNGWGRFASVGLEIAVGAGLGAVVGTWIDHRWHSDPWGVLLGTLLGLFAGMYLVIKDAIRANKN